MFTTLIISTVVNSIPTVEQNFIVACHNLFRSDVARGKGENSNGSLPEGANIKQIFYDNELEKIARKWNCSGGNDEEYGENVYGYTGKPANVLLKACIAWTNTCKYGVSEELIYDSEHSRSGSCTQMIWAESFKIGCAYIDCPIYNYFVCKYSPKGNIPGELIYQKGSLCTKCGYFGCSYGYGLCLVKNISEYPDD
uniref:SCP domain-containing protein n=1 Tax=Meloidogyne incognita TaxID=6306 RepID=A0A914N0M2_MELIC